MGNVVAFRRRPRRPPPEPAGDPLLRVEQILVDIGRDIAESELGKTQSGDVFTAALMRGWWRGLEEAEVSL